MRSLLANVIRIAVVGAVAYGIWVWQTGAGEDGELREFARHACVEAMRSRYDTARINAYEVDKTATGFTVRASVVLANDRRARVVCVTSPGGGVRTMSLEQL